MIRGVAGLALLLVVAMAAYIRLAPLPVARFHQMAGQTAPGGVQAPADFGIAWAVADPQAALADLDRVIRASVRTRVLAGAVGAGHVSYVTRSALWGFPDITNVWVADGAVQIHGQARFGARDFGVNRQRIETWLAALGQGG